MPRSADCAEVAAQSAPYERITGPKDEGIPHAPTREFGPRLIVLGGVPVVGEIAQNRA